MSIVRFSLSVKGLEALLVIVDTDIFIYLSCPFIGKQVAILQNAFSEMTFVGFCDTVEIRYVRDGIKHLVKRNKRKGFIRRRGWTCSILVDSVKIPL